MTNGVIGNADHPVPFSLPTYRPTHLLTYFCQQTRVAARISLTTTCSAAKLSRSLPVYNLPPSDGASADRLLLPAWRLHDGFVVQKEYRGSAARGRRRRRARPPTHADRDQPDVARHRRHHRRWYLRPHRQRRRAVRGTGRRDLDDPRRRRLR